MGWGFWTDDLDCAWFFVVVVCGPAAAVEGAEEGVHFGSEGGRLMGHLPFDSGGIEVSWDEELNETGTLFFFFSLSPARGADV